MSALYSQQILKSTANIRQPCLVELLVSRANFEGSASSFVIYRNR